MHNMAGLSGSVGLHSPTLSPSKDSYSSTPRNRQGSNFFPTMDSPGLRNSFGTGKKHYQIKPIVAGRVVNHQHLENRENLCRDAKGLFVSHVNMMILKKLDKNNIVMINDDRCVLYPMGSFRQKWDVVILVLLVYVSIITPLQIAFFEQDFASLEDWMGWFIMDLIIDAVFITDIVLNFRTAWMSKDPDDYGRYVFKTRDAAVRYCKGWFTVDLLSVIPFYFIDIYLLYAEVPASAASSITRVPKMLKMVRLAKLLRVLRASQIFKRWDRWMAQRVQIGCTKLAQSMVLFVWMLHLMACLWYFAASFEADIRLAWMSKLPSMQQRNGVDLYLAALHWATMTLTTIGYGDIVPITATERIICFIGQLMGVLVSAYVIGTVVLLVQSFIRRSTDFQRSMDAMQDFLKSAGVNQKMRKRCTTYCFYTQDQRKSHSDQRDIRGTMSMFSPALKADLAFQIHKKFVRECFFFVDTPLPVQVLKQVCLALEPVVYGPHEYVARRGHFSYCAYFITRGTLQLEHWVSQSVDSQKQQKNVPTEMLAVRNLKGYHQVADSGQADMDFDSAILDGYDSVVYIDLLHKNESIGTASLFWQCYWYHYYRSLGFCELLLLRQSDFRKMRIYKEFPVSYGVLKASAARRRWRQLFRLLVMLPRKHLVRLREDLMMMSFSNETPTNATANFRSLSPHAFVRTASDRHMNPESPPHESADLPRKASTLDLEPPSPASNLLRRGSVHENKLLLLVESLAKSQQSMQQQLRVLSKAVLGDEYQSRRPSAQSRRGSAHGESEPRGSNGHSGAGLPPVPPATVNRGDHKHGRSGNRRPSSLEKGLMVAEREAAMKAASGQPPVHALRTVEEFPEIASRNRASVSAQEPSSRPESLSMPAAQGEESQHAESKMRTPVSSGNTEDL